VNRKELEEVMRRAEDLCRERGVRLTPQRHAVLEIVCATRKPVSAYEILDLLRERTRNPAPPTVYRALDFLQAQGLVHKLESLHAFVGCAHTEHDHSGQFLICSDCGGVSEIENEAIEKSLQSAEQATGFRTDRPVVELLGTCAECSRQRPASS
jgi:Fur family zinc uptake transcriptional regulator